TSEVPINPLELLPEVPSLNNTFGAFLLGTFVGLMLYGLTLHQTYRYYRLFPGDLKLIRAFVSVSDRVLETIHTALCMHICYYYLVLNYANPLALLDGVWYVCFDALVILVSECFFTRRVYLIACVPATAAHSERGFAFRGSLRAVRFIVSAFTDFDRVAWMTSAGFAAAVAIDVLLAATLVVTLHKSRTGFKRTDSLIDLLIIYTINTGEHSVYSVFGVLSLIFALVWPDSLIWSACNLVATKTYATSLLAVLNSRKRLTDKISEDCFDSGTINLSALKTASDTTQ
ncbi:hypothetical protein PYCCODRAFT_1346148, partial [Trametes coccinea BRFM310]